MMSKEAKRNYVEEMKKTLLKTVSNDCSVSRSQCKRVRCFKKRT